MRKLSPKEQHETQAREILKRRNAGSSNETPAKVDLDDPATHGNVPETVVTPKKVSAQSEFVGRSIKELRVLCNTAKIPYKKKDKAPALIAKLEA